MGMTFDNLDQDAGLKKLNGFLTNRSYVEGFQFSAADAALFHQFSAVPDAAKYANVYRWYVHAAAKLGLRAILVTKKAPKAAAAPAKKAAAAPAKEEEEDDDDDDLFGDDDEEDDEAAKALAAKRAEAAKAAKKEKKKPVERSQVVIEVKPWEAETDLEELAAKIKALPVEGLTWGEGHKLVPVAFGIKKLLVQCVIVDDLVLLDDITEAIEGFEDYVQSVDIASMNKL
ncbi:ef-1 guanine nucleotide exchange domain-containing [Phytophthora cinnamomi]|uniref:ef-1 guanine nucleotide exchange domain-containing n=1 Tax=Phytophthora cinnamomi TaxID=4785 RepID=UPI00355A2589|nr:ef-1 guanine nucleotide exchange domain-containing [Phytophthora cinnamomi]